MLFFGVSTWLLALILLVVIVGATVVGHLVGRSTREQAEDVREPFAVIQAALIGFMGLMLAFGISLAVGRYEARRAAVVEEANAIGAAIALAALALHLAALGRDVRTVLVAAVLVALTLLVTFDLDRPTRGMIRIPDEPLTQLRASMTEPAPGPAR